jgi:hypothetical protein
MPGEEWALVIGTGKELASERDREWVRDRGDRFRGEESGVVSSGGTERMPSPTGFPVFDCARTSSGGERVGLGGSRICSGDRNDSVIMMGSVKLSSGRNNRVHAACACACACADFR